MKKVYLHVKRLFKKFWFIILLASGTSLVIGLGVLVVMTAISLLFFEDPVDIDSILENFSEEQLEIIFSEEMDETVSDDEYFSILARYQTFICPKKADRITTWIGSEVTDTAYIQKYELKKMYDGFSSEILKKNIISRINKNGIAAQRAIRSNRRLEFVYHIFNTDETFTLVITPNELS